MKCPTCVSTTLVISERQGIEIDYCPQCRGIWLDRGELDKLLERAASHSGAAQPSSGGHNQSTQHAPAPYPPAQHEHAYRGHDKYAKHYKHKSWLSEIFD